MSEAVFLVTSGYWKNYKHLSHSVRPAAWVSCAGCTENLGFQEAEAYVLSHDFIKINIPDYFIIYNLVF